MNTTGTGFSSDDSGIREGHTNTNSTSAQSLASYQCGSPNFGASPVQSSNLKLPCTTVGGKASKQAQIEAPALDDANFAAKLVNVRNWWNLGVALLVLWNKLDEIERVYTTVEDRLKAIFAYFKHMHPYANWRCVIWGLDECGDTQLANNIRSYAEPIADPSLTVENIIGVLKLMKSRWYTKMSHILAVPTTTKMRMKQQYSSEEDQLKAFVEYIYAFHPRMSWELLAGVLHSMEEHKALEELRARNYLVYEKDPSLTMNNVKTTIRGMKNWHRFGWWLDVPLSKRDEIKNKVTTLEEQIEALLQEWLEHHPCPNWRLFAWALLRRREPPEHRMLKQLYGNYIPENLMISSEASLLKLFVKMVVKKNEVLGQGTYGCVEVVLCHGVEYAAKRLRTDVRGQDKMKFYQRFGMEYELLSSLEHKNIVAYKGLCFLSHSDLADVPLLMMERLKIDLHRRLVDNSEEYPDPLTLREKISILLDVAEGLEYLHTHIPPVIHRDLTAKNVLLDEKNTAKIGDFGNSRILNVDQSSCFETMTCNLGTLHYSAPEAYPASSSQSYSVKIDIFSFGHMALFVMTGEFLYELLPAVQIQPDGTRESFSEKERRTKYVDMLQKVCDENDIQLMLTLVTDCLDNRPQKRPTAKKLIKHLKSFQC